MTYDTRPAFARILWRDRTQEHWVDSMAIDAISTLISWGVFIGLLYITRQWWVPGAISVVCN